MHTLFLIFFAFTGSLLHAQDIAGRWTTIDDNTGKARSLVEITVRDGVATGRVVEILDKTKEQRVCTECPGDRKGQPLLGMEIIRDLERKGNEWTNGTILDPESGKVYDAKLWLEGGELKVRGYVAFFYRTQTWVRGGR